MRVYRQEKAYVAVDYNILFEVLFYAANGTRSVPAFQKRAVKRVFFTILEKPLLRKIPQPPGLLCGAYHSGSSPECGEWQREEEGH
jgi:hypothetical protein